MASPRKSKKAAKPKAKGKPRGKGKPFAKGNPGGPGRPPKSTEITELKRLLAFAETNNLQDRLLEKMWAAAQAGEEWAMLWFANRFWPEAHVARKINEVNPDEEVADLFREAIEAVRNA